MSFFTAEVFSRRHGGFEGLARFVDMCEHGCPACQEYNKRRGNKKRIKCKLKHVAEEFDLSVSEICQLRLKLGHQAWVPGEGLKNYFALHEGLAERQYKERRAVIVSLKDGTLAE